MLLDESAVDDRVQTDGFGEELAVVVLAAWLTAWVAWPLLPVKLLSPP